MRVLWFSEILGERERVRFLGVVLSVERSLVTDLARVCDAMCLYRASSHSHWSFDSLMVIKQVVSVEGSVCQVSMLSHSPGHIMNRSCTPFTSNVDLTSGY